MLEYLPELLKGLHTSLTLTVASIVVALVLALIFTDRDQVRVVEQHVGGHQHRIGEQADRGGVGALLLGLVLELGHARGLSEAREAAQCPCQLGV